MTAVVGIGGEADFDGEAQERVTGAEVGNLRRSLEALSDEEVALLRVIRRSLTVEGLGRHPLGNLALAAAADALGDYGQASLWLGEQLGIAGAVLPATVGPGQRRIEAVDPAATEQTPGGPVRRAWRLRLVGDQTESPKAAVAAVLGADWVLLAPGALYRSLLSAAAAPDLVAALRSTPARVVWIANLTPDPQETPDLTAMEHLVLLRWHGVRVDAVLHDPSAGLAFDPGELGCVGVESVARPLRKAASPAAHDPDRLQTALSELLHSHPAATGR